MGSGQWQGRMGRRLGERRSYRGKEDDGGVKCSGVDVAMFARSRYGNPAGLEIDDGDGRGEGRRR